MRCRHAAGERNAHQIDDTPEMMPVWRSNASASVESECARNSGLASAVAASEHAPPLTPRKCALRRVALVIFASRAERVPLLLRYAPWVGRLSLMVLGGSSSSECTTCYAALRRAGAKESTSTLLTARGGASAAAPISCACVDGVDISGNATTKMRKVKEYHTMGTSFIGLGNMHSAIAKVMLHAVQAGGRPGEPPLKGSAWMHMDFALAPKRFGEDAVAPFLDDFWTPRAGLVRHTWPRTPSDLEPRTRLDLHTAPHATRLRSCV